MAEKTIQIGTRVRVQIPVEVLTLNEGLHRRTVRPRNDEDGRKLEGVVVGLPDNQRDRGVAGITAYRADGEAVVYPSRNYTVKLDRGDGKPSRLVNAPSNNLETI